jgi:hypothetical protein
LVQSLFVCFKASNTFDLQVASQVIQQLINNFRRVGLWCACAHDC